MANPLIFDDASFPDFVRTVAFEAGGEPDEGKRAVASVILNRARQSGLSPSQVVRAPYQFEPWQTKRKAIEAFGPDHPDYQKIASIVEPLYKGAQPLTTEADHFYSPGVLKDRNAPTPSWAKGDYEQYGTQRFFKLGYRAGSGVPGTTNAGFFSSPPPTSRPMADPFNDDLSGYVPPELIKARMERARRQGGMFWDHKTNNWLDGLVAGIGGMQGLHGERNQEKALEENQKISERALRRLSEIDNAPDKPTAPPQTLVPPAGPAAAASGGAVVPTAAPGVVPGPAGLPSGRSPEGLLTPSAPPPGVQPLPRAAPPAAPGAPPLDAARPGFGDTPGALDTARQKQRMAVIMRMSSMGGPIGDIARSELKAEQDKRLQFGLQHQKAQLDKQLALEQKHLEVRERIAGAVASGEMSEAEGQRYLGIMGLMRQPGQPGPAPSAGGVPATPAPTPAAARTPIPTPGGATPAGPARDARGVVMDPNHEDYLLSPRAVQLKKAIRFGNATGQKTEALQKQLEQDPSYQAQKERADQRGKAQGMALNGLAKVISSTNRLFGYIDDILYAKDPKTGKPMRNPETGALLPNTQLDDAVGKWVGSARIPDELRSPAVIDMHARIEQIAGSAFLQALEAMKGAGTVTDIEGAKGAAARLRGKLTQSPQAFRQALEDFRQEVMEMRRVAEATAQGEVPLGNNVAPDARRDAPAAKAEGEPAARPDWIPKEAKWMKGKRNGKDVEGYAVPDSNSKSGWSMIKGPASAAPPAAAPAPTTTGSITPPSGVAVQPPTPAAAPPPQAPQEREDLAPPIPLQRDPNRDIPRTPTLPNPLGNFDEKGQFRRPADPNAPGKTPQRPHLAADPNLKTESIQIGEYVLDSSATRLYKRVKKTGSQDDFELVERRQPQLQPPQ